MQVKHKSQEVEEECKYINTSYIIYSKIYFFQIKNTF